ncbi:hypothetical protein RJT34_28639 [Clitoria ternatea]|uniref:Cyclin-dependent protein kinase inhibitor SMR2 n=1 Tax=Clitoria ternatea TaxID=43366 RepID=A0AAN9F942_CLITE
MDTGSSEKKQGIPHTEAVKSEGKHGEEDVMPKLMIKAKEVMEDEETEECKTPTWSGNQIPTMLQCPPAPKKSPLPPLLHHREFTFFEHISPGEVEEFFQSLYEFRRINQAKRL